MKTFIQKVLVVMLATFIMSLLVKGIIQVGDTTIYENDIQILYDLDYPQTQLNNHSLREVFESSTPQLSNLVNGSFSTSTGWTVIRANLSVANNELTLTNTGTTDFRVRNNDLLLANNVYYISSQIKETNSTNIRYFIGSSTGAIYTSIININTSTFITSKQALLPTNDGYLTFQGGQSGTSIIGETIVLKNTHVFNLTASHGVISTSGTSYDKAIAEIEWFLSINDGYFQNQVNWFEIVDLTIQQMDYWYNIYQTLKALEV